MASQMMIFQTLHSERYPHHTATSPPLRHSCARRHTSRLGYFPVHMTLTRSTDVPSYIFFDRAGMGPFGHSSGRNYRVLTVYWLFKIKRRSKNVELLTFANINSSSLLISLKNRIWRGGGGGKVSSNPTPKLYLKLIYCYQNFTVIALLEYMHWFLGFTHSQTTPLVS
jgi:hypothetical protein